MRTLGMVLVGLLAVALEAAAGVHPRELPLSAQRALRIGNAAMVRVRGPGGLVPAPIGCNGSVMLAERVLVGDVQARTLVQARLQAHVAGDVVVTEGGVQLANQVHVDGDVTARDTVVLSIGAEVDGDLTSTRGAVKVGRLAVVGGNVYAGGEFRGERDVQIGAPGTVVALAAGGQIRDRSEYFGDILHEGLLTFVGTRRAKVHGDVVAMAPDSLVEPAMRDWSLETVPSRRIVPGSDSRRIVKTKNGGTVLAPGSYGSVVLEEDAVIALEAGEYSFDQLATGPSTGMVVDLGDGAGTVTIQVRGDVGLGRRFRMTVRGGGEGDPAARILFRVGGTFRSEQDGILHGTIIADRAAQLGKHTRLTGAAWSRGLLDVGRDSEIVWVPSALLD